MSASLALIAEPSAQLPAHISAAKASLPRSYEAAKTALAECLSIDECKDWADKAAALASYAKQANDEEMMRQATRIRDRAIRRCGELLKQVDGRGGDTGKSVDDRTFAQTQRNAADAAGMSKHQQVQAVRVANVPAAEFERQVESPTPPTVTTLAEQGKKAAPKPVIDLKGRDPEEFNRAMHYVSGWEYAARDLSALNHDGALSILTPPERERLRVAISAIDAITDRTITRI